VNLFVGDFSDVNDIVVLLVEPLFEVVDVINRLLIDLLLELNDIGIDIGLELLLVFHLLSAQICDHVVKDTLDIFGCLADLLLAKLHGLLVLLLRKLLPCFATRLDPCLGNFGIVAIRNEFVPHFFFALLPF